MTIQSSVCSQRPAEHRTSNTTLIFMAIQLREPSPRSPTATQTGVLQHLTSVQSWTRLTGWCLEPTRFVLPWHFVKRHFYRWGPGFGVIPFPLWLQRLSHSTGLFPRITKKAKLALRNRNKSKGLHKHRLPCATHSSPSLKITWPNNARLATFAQDPCYARCLLWLSHQGWIFDRLSYPRVCSRKGKQNCHALD